MKACNILDLDDLILLPTPSLQRNEEVCERWQNKTHYLLVDKYQDTNTNQYELAKLLVGQYACFTMVGDDDQSICPWRGVRPWSLVSPSQDSLVLQVIKLGRNYRSSGRILKAASILTVSNPHVFKERPFSKLGYGTKLKVLPANNGDHETERVAGELIAHHLANKTNHKGYTVLYRGSHQSRVSKKTLMQNRIPYRIPGGTPFFSHPGIKDPLAYLRILTNPNDDSAFLRIVNMPKHEIGPAILQKLGRWAVSRNKDLSIASFGTELSQTPTGRRYESLMRFTHWLRETQWLTERRPAIAIYDLIRGIDYESQLCETSSNPRTAEMRMRSVSRLFTWMIEILGGSEIDEPMTLTQTIIRFILRGMMERGGLDEESDQMQLMILHVSKGLRFPYIRLVGMEEGLLPHQSSIDKDNIDEERRLVYAGITRVQEELAFTFCRERRQYGRLVCSEPSRFLFELPQGDLIREQERKIISVEECMHKGQVNVVSIKAVLAEAKKDQHPQTTNYCQAAEEGTIGSNKSSILTVEKTWIPHGRKPITSIITLPQAVKSAITAGLISTMIKVAAKDRIMKIASWGIKVTVITYPSVEMKTAAVKKSSTDLISRVVGSPVTPLVKVPEMLVPLVQRRTSTMID